MALPVHNTPISFRKVDLPSGKKMGIKPWKVLEEKDLLFAIEDQTDDDAIRKEIINMISRCVDDQSTFKKLSNVDYVALLMELRKISKSAKIEYTYPCTNPKCKFELSDDVDLNKDVLVKLYSGKTVPINDKKSFALKEVPFETYDMLKQKYPKTTEYNYNFILNSIDSIIEDGEVYSEFTNEELTVYIDELESEEFKALSVAIDESLATIELKKSLKCGRCKTEMDVQFGDLYSFLFF